ncbi:MAG: cysteine desulfurase family protein, partial [Flavobacteriales bacterium]
MRPSIYLDNAATTAIAPEVMEAMTEVMRTCYGNPSSTHAFGRKSKSLLEQSRRKIASLIHCKPSEIVFTSGGTEADNTAMRFALSGCGCERIVTTALEHSAVIKTAEMNHAQHHIPLQLIRIDERGIVSLQHLEELLMSGPIAFVSLMHANNEVANLLSLQEAGNLCRKYGAVFHSDTVQTMGHYPFDMSQLPVDILNASAHKFHGPKGVGFMYIRDGIKGDSVISGGGQERGIRGGTENLHSIVGMARALELAYAELDEHRTHITSLKQMMRDGLRERIPGIIFNGESADDNSLYTVLNVTFPPSHHADMLLFLLDLEGIACSGGSACSSGAS